MVLRLTNMGQGKETVKPSCNPVPYEVWEAWVPLAPGAAEASSGLSPYSLSPFPLQSFGSCSGSTRVSCGAWRVRRERSLRGVLHGAQSGWWNNKKLLSWMSQKTDANERFSWMRTKKMSAVLGCPKVACTRAGYWRGLDERKLVQSILYSSLFDPTVLYKCIKDVL